jgi:hypothetical protein
VKQGLWSVNRIAAEFGVDRRTATQLLRQVRPCGSLKGHPAWTLPVAAAVLGPYVQRRGMAPGGPTSAPPPTPPGWSLVEEAEHDLDRGYVIAALTTTYEMQRLAAVVTVDEGVPVATAYRVANVLMLTMLGLLGTRAKAWGIEPWASADDVLHVELGFTDEAFTRVNWPSLAHKSGDPDWTPPAYFGAWPEIPGEQRAALVARGIAEDD